MPLNYARQEELCLSYPLKFFSSHYPISLRYSFTACNHLICDLPLLLLPDVPPVNTRFAVLSSSYLSSSHTNYEWFSIFFSLTLRLYLYSSSRDLHPTIYSFRDLPFKNFFFLVHFLCLASIFGLIIVL